MNTRCWNVLFLALVIANASCSGKGDSGQENDAGTASSDEANQTDSTMLADDAGSQQAGETTRPTPEFIAKLLQEIEDEKAKLPRDRIDPTAVVVAAREPSKLVERPAGRPHGPPWQ